MKAGELESNLYDEALALLQNRPRSITFADIEAKTGISESWLRAFSRKAITNPGVRQIETLIAYLKVK